MQQMTRRTPPQPLTINISMEAATHVREFTAQAGKPGLNLRVGVKGGGCSGLTYVLDLVGGAGRERQDRRRARPQAVRRQKVLRLPGRHGARVLGRAQRQGLRVQQPQRKDDLRLRHVLQRLGRADRNPPFAERRALCPPAHKSKHPPERYSTHHEEYDAVTRAAGLAHRSHLGRLELTGEDTLDLLNRLSTNKLENLTPGEGMGSVLTSAKGRIVDLLVVLMLEDRLLLIVGPGRARAGGGVDRLLHVHRGRDSAGRDTRHRYVLSHRPRRRRDRGGDRRRGRGGTATVWPARGEHRRRERDRGARRLR